MLRGSASTGFPFDWLRAGSKPEGVRFGRAAEGTHKGRPYGDGDGWW